MSRKHFTNRTLLIILVCLAGSALAACRSVQAAGIAQNNPASAQSVDLAVATLHAGLTETAAAVTPTPPQPPTLTPVPSETPLPTATFTATPDTRPDPNQWSAWPVIPTLSGVAKEIYARGIANGNVANGYSVVGDCQSEPAVFMGIYEMPGRYWFVEGEEYLQETVDYFYGSFSHVSLSMRDGLSAPSALDPKWADKTACAADENPVQCELRIRKPAIMFVNLGTNWKAGASAERYESYLRQIVDLIIANGTLPILSTKADNVEGDYSLNRATVRVAYDYDIPLWNFWLAAQSLPNGGLDSERDNIYLSFPDGWDRRNYTALQTLDSIRKELIAAGLIGD